MEKDLATQRDQIRSGAIYNDLRPQLVAARAHAVKLTNAYNQSVGQPDTVRQALLSQLLKKVGRNAFFEPDFRCEFGDNISLGDDFYANFDCIMLDGATITIGDQVLFGPRVSLYTSNHAPDADERAAGACYAKPIKIGDHVWLGGGVTVAPGVSIGANTIIGAGSVVTKNIPENVIAVGNPAHVLRAITAADRRGYDPERD
ncbi:sugar O-acetyltransferase [Lapidilactobacillus luobeiensis]|uniref:sugar O-acetyltransferase n=1 Tax=Lapidilactobacillus luobeiensis TaxID=2950371 RepID=UPI0021C32E63|nr:sugar O-acetyltransferase [Lapidilactobacillus luobeiensis]